MSDGTPTPSASSPWPIDRRHGALAFVLATVVLALGLWLGRYHELGGYMVENDFYGQFYPAARAVLDGTPMANPRSGPGYPLLLVAGSFLTSDLFLVGKVLASVALAAAGWLTFLCVRAIANATAGLIAQLFCYAILGRYCIVVSNDVVFVAVVTASLFFTLRRQHPRALDLVLAGAFAGFAMSLRYPGVALLPVALTALWLRPATAGGALGFVRAAALYALPAVAGSAPAWAAQHLGLSAGKESKAYAFVAADIYSEPKDRLSPTHLDAMETRFTSMWDVFTRDPKRVVSHYTTDLFEDAVRMTADSVTLPAAFFLGAGFLLWFAFGAADRRRAAAFLVFPAVSFGIAALVPYQARYGYPLVPAAAGLLGAALAYGWIHPARGDAAVRIAARVRRLCLALVFLPPLAMTTIKLREYLTTEPVELIAAADVLRPLAQPGDRLIARKGHLPHLAGLQATFPKMDVDLDGFLAWARSVKARFLLAGDWEARTNAALRPLIAGDAPAGLRLLWRNASPAHSLYEILPQ